MLVPLGTHQRTDSIASYPLVSADLVQQFTCPRKSHKRVFSLPGKTAEDSRGGRIRTLPSPYEGDGFPVCMLLPLGASR